MAPKYAGIMALIGMSTVMLRAIKAGSLLETVVPTALGWLVALGIAGWLVGMIADWTVSDSVRTQLEQELLEIEQAQALAGAKKSSDAKLTA